MTLVSKTFELYGKTYTFESGELAKQATGACLVKQGDTTMLDTVVVSKERKNYDFFPLTVDFNEKMYAAGRIPGGYLKREGRPSEKATLTARMIDRPIRPSFPDGFRNEVHIVATSLVADQVNPFDVINVMGASLAMTLGGVPFEGPLACVRIGRNVETGEFIVNPTYEERENSDLDLELGGSADFISMVEAGAEEISEDDMLAAMKFGQEALAAFCQAQDEFVAEWEQVNGPIVKKEYPLDQPVEEVQERIFAHYDEMAAALRDADKLSRIGKVEALKESIRAEFTEEEQAAWEREIPVALKKLEKKAMRTMVVETGERVDGRAADEIRPIMVKDNYLPLVHGSGLFQRGQTQVLSVLSLGMLNEGQRLDTIEPTEGKRYMHHYNFPPFCTGETGRMGSPKRREIGHGNLAERALLPVLPDENEFPYAIRVVSEVMESNGSSSMASTCGSTLALMDGGVPIKRPVSGIAMGLIQEEGKTVVLSDIQGLEDFLGDMDFKVTGTTEGITVREISETGQVIETFAERLKGRYTVHDVVDPQTGELLFSKDHMLTGEAASLLEAWGIESLEIRSVLTCRARNGVCSRCYGVNLAIGEPVGEGEAVGIIAAQSIGEPGTQLPMRTFHTGGVAGGDITQGLPRVEELFEARKPKKMATLAEIGGKVRFEEATKGSLLNIIVTADDGDTRTYSVPHTGLQVRDGDVIEKGKQLQDGALNPHDVLRIRGASAVHNYLIQEVLKVYRQQGVDINDKHIEVIVRQMMRKVRVEDANDTGLLSGAMADVLEVEDENERVRQRIEAGEVREDGEPLQEATYTQLLMGITKASLATDSFLSAASFQETTKVLTEAAIKGKVDHLVGLKENVIIGKLIPAGTGLNAYRHFAEELVPVTEEELQEEQPEEQATGVEALQEDAAQVLEETPGQDEQDQE